MLNTTILRGPTGDPPVWLEMIPRSEVDPLGAPCASEPEGASSGAVRPAQLPTSGHPPGIVHTRGGDSPGGTDPLVRPPDDRPASDLHSGVGRADHGSDGEQEHSPWSFWRESDRSTDIP